MCDSDRLKYFNNNVPIVQCRSGPCWPFAQWDDGETFCLAQFVQEDILKHKMKHYIFTLNSNKSYRSSFEGGET